MKIVHGSPGFGSQLTEEQTVKFLTDKKLNLFWYAFLDPFYTWDRLNPWLSIESSHKKTKIMRPMPNI